MKKFIDIITGEIVTSKFFKKMRSIFGSLKMTATESADGQLNEANPNNPFDAIGEVVSGKIKKIIKKFGKKFKNEEKADSVIRKTVSCISKVACVAATVAFFALVAYVIVKILPTVITAIAILVAFYIISYITMAIIDNGLGTNKNANVEAAEV